MENNKKDQLKQAFKSGPEIEITHFSGTINIGKDIILCAVLKDGTALLVQRELVGLLTGNIKGGLDRYLQAKNLQDFVPEKFKNKSLSESLYQFKKGSSKRILYGYSAEDIIDICYMYIQARNAGKLLKIQNHLAIKAEMIILASAKAGLSGVIYEAVGYDKDKKTLQKLLDKFLLKEHAKWAKRFPDEFFKEIFRLRKWQWKGMNIPKPSVLGHWINDIVYDRLAPGLLDELKTLNPPDKKGNRKVRFQQYLTEDMGHPALQSRLTGLMALQRASANWTQFMRSVQRAYPKPNENIQTDFEDME